MTDYAALRALHRPGDPVVLANVWDAGSARVVEEAGHPAVATASAAISAMLGYPDGEGAPAGEMFAAAARVVRAVSVPVTVDAEAGYGLAPGALAERLRAIGAAGLNLEDSRGGTLVDAAEQAAYLAALRAADPDLVINARVDVYAAGNGDLAEAVERGRRYRDAGADCVYPILVTDEAAISALVEALGAVNVLCLPGMTVPGLAALGVARISFGPAFYRRALDGLREAVTALR
ncbi:isocitrate lyase/PEP mutase family protein [Actinomadura parmotrematis]|uniref:Isocitrate lyase/phosphoenolpyruvate mutase family protein n=1 Tax=Actinomadura parmotrematis TaxID=2864039 RepID=A0ABS7G0K3_9ACTN|nr:isocitrate lyase/phosphoenolpyruvate mutase family protein [Actinomadura parmotrematis]MBW8485920.1 isocitrate lyase/phosphoenolpyruvate mutase family protein [Actinomadura parmotrematis]